MKLSDIYKKAKKEKRICERCGWIVTVSEWRKGSRLCYGCKSGLMGVNPKYGHGQPIQKPQDFTGEML